jgi:imidazolonepropionase-like amidohydrolase
MAPIRHFLALSLIVLGACAQAPERVTITNVTLIDGLGGPPRSGVDLVLEGNRIAAITPTGEREPRGRVVDGTGLHALPGLWDFHVHLGFAPQLVIRSMLDAGITSIRDVGDGCTGLRAIRDSIRAGTREGPRIVMASLILESPEELRLHADLRQRAESLGVPPMATGEAGCDRIAVTGAADAERAVAAAVAAGAEFIKARSFVDGDTYLAIVRAAHARGLRLVAHPPYATPAPLAMVAGVSSFEHGFYPWPPTMFPPDTLAAIHAAMRQHGIALVPTLIAWESRALPFEQVMAEIRDSTAAPGTRRAKLPPELVPMWLGAMGPRMVDPRDDLAGWRQVLDQHMRQIGEMLRAGVRVLPGSDAPGSALVYPGPAIVDELALFVRGAGMTPMDAIRSATAVAAQHMGMADSLGTLEVGKLADLILVAGDPAADIRNLEHVRVVITDGRVVRGG